MRIDRERMILDAMRVVKKVLTKGSAQHRLIARHLKGCKAQRSVFRIPTKKELDKHPKLLNKQRRKGRESI